MIELEYLLKKNITTRGGYSNCLAFILSLLPYGLQYQNTGVILILNKHYVRITPLPVSLQNLYFKLKLTVWILMVEISFEFRIYLFNIREL